MKEASEIFAHYNINGGFPPIEEILFNQEEIRRLQSTDQAAYNENLRKKIPIDVLIDNISELNDNFAIQNNGLGFVLRDRLTEFNQRNVYNEDIVINCKGPKEEPIPPKLDLTDPYPIKFSPFDYFCCHKESLLPKGGNMI